MEFYDVGFLFDPGHLSRAMCCRLTHNDTDSIASLPPGFHVNHPRLGRVTICEQSRETSAKTKEHSLNWCQGDTTAEVTDGTRGMCVDK